MKDQMLEIKTSIQVLCTPEEVFEAIADPEKITGYFLSRSSGRLEPGRTVNWKFPEFDIVFPVRVKKVEKDSYLSFFWDSEDGSETLVEITLAPAGDRATKVSVEEKGMPDNEAGIRWLKGNTEGWANFLACLKAYLEYGINLRKGAFDYLKPATE